MPRQSVDGPPMGSTHSTVLLRVPPPQRALHGLHGLTRYVYAMQGAVLHVLVDGGRGLAARSHADSERMRLVGACMHCTVRLRVPPPHCALQGVQSPSRQLGEDVLAMVHGLASMPVSFCG